MSTVVIRSEDYWARLPAVLAAQREADLAGRYHEAQALGLAAEVLESLMADEEAAGTVITTP
jgi:hypothetical protein